MHWCEVASKCGFNCLDGGDGSVTNSAAHIKTYIEGTIERLGFAPDLYYLHRIDPSESFPCLLKVALADEGVRNSFGRIYPSPRRDPEGREDQVYWSF